VISIQVRPHCGSNIKDVFAKSCALAALLGVAIEFNFNDYECTAYWNGTGHMMWKYKPGWESGLTGRYENGVVKDWGGDRKRIKPLDTLPPAGDGK